MIRKRRPLISPVNYTLDGDVIIFRTVAFEADDVDEAPGTGWNVLIRDFAYEITNAIDHLPADRRRS